MSDPRLLFVHIPKTAGTSLWSMLSTRFDQSEILRVNQTWRQWSQLVKQVNGYRLVGGHVGYGFVHAFEQPPKVMTFLRHPIERALSAYRHLRYLDSSASSHQVANVHRDARTQVERSARELSLLDFVRTEPLAAVHLGNVQTFYLSSNGIERPPYHDLGQSDLARAKENLSRCDCIGLTEHFGDSLQVLCHTMRWEPFAGMHHANATPGRTEEIDPSTLDALREMTELDEELFRFAIELAERRLRSMLEAESLNDSRGERRLLPSLSLKVGGDAFTFDRAIPGDGWYGPERMGGVWSCWTGPGNDAWIRLATAPRLGTVLRIRVLHALRAENIFRTQVIINEMPLSVRVSAEPGAHVLDAELTAEPPSSIYGHTRLVIRVPELHRPCDLDPGNPDSRRLGLAISSISLVPSGV